MGKWGAAVGFGTPSALRGCGRGVYNYSFRHALGVEGKGEELGAEESLRDEEADGDEEYAEDEG